MLIRLNSCILCSQCQTNAKWACNLKRDSSWQLSLDQITLIYALDDTTVPNQIANMLSGFSFVNDEQFHQPRSIVHFGRSLRYFDTSALLIQDPITRYRIHCSCSRDFIIPYQSINCRLILRLLLPTAWWQWASSTVRRVPRPPFCRYGSE